MLIFAVMKERQPSAVELALTLTKRHWDITQGLIEGKSVTLIARDLEMGLNSCSSLKRDIAVRMGEESNITPGICKAIVIGIASGRLSASSLVTEANSLTDKEIQFLDLMHRGTVQADIMKIMNIKPSKVSSMRANVPKHMGLATIYSAVAWVAWQEKMAGRLEPEDLKKIFSLETPEADRN